MASASQPVPTPEQNKKLILRWFEELWNQGNRDVINELFDEKGILHDGSSDIHGPQEFVAFYDNLQSQFSNFVITPVVCIAEGTFACLHWIAEFRHKDSSKPLRITGTSIVRVQDGKFIEAWQNWDAAAVEVQLTAHSL